MLLLRQKAKTLLLLSSLTESYVQKTTWRKEANILHGFQGQQMGFRYIELIW